MKLHIQMHDSDWIDVTQGLLRVQP